MTTNTARELTSTARVTRPPDRVFDVDALTGELGVELAFRVAHCLGTRVGLAAPPVRGERLGEAELGLDPDVGLVREDRHLTRSERARRGGRGDRGEVMRRAITRVANPEESTEIVGDRLERVHMPMPMRRVLDALRGPAALARSRNRHEAAIHQRGALRVRQRGELRAEHVVIAEARAVRRGDPMSGEQRRQLADRPVDRVLVRVERRREHPIRHVPTQVDQRQEQPTRERHLMMAARTERTLARARREPRFALGSPCGTDLGDQPRELRARQARQLTHLPVGEQRRTTNRCHSHDHIIPPANYSETDLLIGALRTLRTGGESSTVEGSTVVEFSDGSIQRSGVYPRIHGEADGTGWTLEDCFRTQLNSRLGGGIELETIHVNQILKGVLFKENEELEATGVSIELGTAGTGRA